jgi:uncharacterized protein
MDEQYDITIKRDGTWLYNGTSIERVNMVKLFASVLKIDQAGDYWLQTPAEKGRITVEDLPFQAVEMQIESSGKSQNLLFRTNLDDHVTAGSGHDIVMDPLPAIHVRNGLYARISRAVYYDMVKIATDEEGRTGLWSRSTFYPLT